jgi:hypothetical protein
MWFLPDNHESPDNAKPFQAKETTQRVAEWAAKVQSKGVTVKQMY